MPACAAFLTFILVRAWAKGPKTFGNISLAQLPVQTLTTGRPKRGALWWQRLRRCILCEVPLQMSFALDSHTHRH